MAQNIADEAQVKEGASKSKRIRERELMDVKLILETDYGRRFIWRLLEKAKVFGSIWEQSARIHYNSGQQDFGHFVMSEVTESNPESLILMMKESKKREDNDA